MTAINHNTSTIYHGQTSRSCLGSVVSGNLSSSSSKGSKSSSCCPKDTRHSVQSKHDVEPDPRANVKRLRSGKTPQWEETSSRPRLRRAAVGFWVKRKDKNQKFLPSCLYICLYVHIYKLYEYTSITHCWKSMTPARMTQNIIAAGLNHFDPRLIFSEYTQFRAVYLWPTPVRTGLWAKTHYLSMLNRRRSVTRKGKKKKATQKGAWHSSITRHLGWGLVALKRQNAVLWTSRTNQVLTWNRGRNGGLVKFLVSKCLRHAIRYVQLLPRKLCGLFPFNERQTLLRRHLEAILSGLA